MRVRMLLIALAVASVLSGSSALADRIDATKGRQYPISKQHGPWMIMVVSLSEPPPERRKAGITPEEAADELVYALRKRGIPAYAHRVGEEQEHLKTTTRIGRVAKAHVRSQQGAVCVLAGNYKSAEDRVGQDTLKFIKKMALKDLHLDSWEQNGVYAKTPGQPGPFSGAFLTMNPILTMEDIARTKAPDPLLIKLNAGGENTIMANKGKYTLVIATFRGLSQTGLGNSGYKQALEKFKVTDTLDDGAERALTVARMLRGGELGKEALDGNQTGRKFDAWVFHDHHQSLVTVGSFDSADDPRIAVLAETFGAKTRAGANGQTYTIGGACMLPGNPPEAMVFDPRPRLIEVPKLR